MGENSVNIDAVKTEETTEANEFWCEHCSAVFDSAAKLDSHNCEDYYVEDEDDEEDDEVCNFCGELLDDCTCDEEDEDEDEDDEDEDDEDDDVDIDEETENTHTV